MLRDDTMIANAATSSLVDAVRATPGVDAWQVTTARREEAQVYLIGADIQEARRLVTSEAATIKLHNMHAPHSADGEGLALGETTLTILPDEQADADRLAARLRDGALMASLTDNQPFSLPGMPAQGFPSVESEDLSLGASIEAAVERAGQRLRAALRQTPGVRLGSAEIYATRTERSLTNSAGLNASTRETGAFLDLALLAGEGDNIAEFHAELQRRRLSDLHVERLVAAYGAFALHALHATAPDAWEGPVILSGDAVTGFFDSHFGGPLLAHASAEMAYQRMSRFKTGEFITGEEPRGDRLTLASDATRPYGVRTSAYDGSGIPAQTVTLIEDGVFKRPWADARYAQYLGVPATGEVGNLKVNRGSTPLESLRAVAGGPVYEIVAFSLFNPDPVTGDFSTEIRLGYRHDASGVRPIKGGSLVGNIFSALADARFSAEPYTDGVYFGPAAIRFANLRITAG